ncbi:MAG: phosphotriesterase [Vicinamibacterales bacterium]
MIGRRAEPGEVQTVLGPADPATLGLVLPHEHILCDVTPPDVRAAAGGVETPITLENVHDVRYHWIRHYGNHVLDDVATAVNEVARFREAGGGTIVDVTIAGIRPQPAGLAEVARRTSVNIVAGTGYYIESFAGALISGRSVESLAADLIASFDAGFEGSGVRPGIVGEIGVSDPWSTSERRVMSAAVLTQQEVGAAITVHPGRDPGSPLAVVRHVAACGGDTTRLIIGHLDRTLFTYDEVARLLDEGCVGEWDFFGIESSYYPFADIDLPNDGQRLNLIKRLVTAGYGDRILISQDICTKTRLVRWGGHGYAHLPAAVIPMMRRKGFAEADIERITRQTPARLLTLKAPG